MKAWIHKRMTGGAALPQPEPIGELREVMQLLVVNVTDQGQRRPGRVGRVMQLGAKRAVDQLINPRLTWLKAGVLVLTGTEEVETPAGRTAFAQSWVCRLAMPAQAPLRAMHRYKNGVEVPRRMLGDRYSTTRAGELVVAGAADSDLGRHTLLATLTAPNPSAAFGRDMLIDCELDWMSDDRFEVSGFERRAAQGDEPARLLRQGWVCGFDLAGVAVAQAKRGGRPTL